MEPGSRAAYERRHRGGRLRIYEAGKAASLSEIELQQPSVSVSSGRDSSAWAGCSSRPMPDRARQAISLKAPAGGPAQRMSSGDFIAVRYVLTDSSACWASGWV